MNTTTQTRETNEGIKSVRIRLVTWRKFKQLSLNTDRRLIDLLDDIATKELAKGE